MKSWLLVSVTVLLLAIACSDGDQQAATDTPTAKETALPTRSPGPTSTPRPLAGVDIYDWETWTFERKSFCASPAADAPFLGPVVFSVSRAELPDIPLPPGQGLVDTRMCKLSGVTALNYILSPALHIELVATSTAEWPVHVPLDQVRAQATDSGEVIVAPMPEVNAGIGVMAIRPVPFGLIVAYGGLTEEEVVSAVTAIDASAVQVPEGKEWFVGEMGGIQFFPAAGYDSSQPCTYSQYGFLTAQPTGAPADTRIAIEPSYLPAGASLDRDTYFQTCGGIESAESIYTTDLGQYYIVRKSGAPEWGSFSSEDWYTATKVGGLDAVVLAPPARLAPEVDTGATLFVREEFGLTVIDGPDRDQLMLIAEGLNR